MPLFNLPTRLAGRTSAHRATMGLAVIFALLFSLSFPIALYADAGALDPDFGNHGVVCTDFSRSDTPSAIAIQPDKKIIVAGDAYSSSTYFDFALARYNNDGSIDTEFGAGGKVITSLCREYDHIYAVAVQPDNRIVAVGAALSRGTDYDFALVRYNPDGSLDNKFGDHGKVITDFFGGHDMALAIDILPTGKILVSGWASTNNSGVDFALALYNKDGSLNTGFGNGGKVTTDFFGGEDRAYAMAVYPNGGIVVAGYAYIPSTGLDFALARYNKDGSLDSAFGFSGKITTDFFGRDDMARAVVLEPGGDIVVAGGAYTPLTGSDFALARYDRRGEIDQGFGLGGKATASFGTDDERAFAVGIEPGGQIIAAGNKYHLASQNIDSDFALACFDRHGNLDTSFGAGGIVCADFFGDNDLILAAEILPTGRILAAGSAYNNSTGNDFALACYLRR